MNEETAYFRKLSNPECLPINWLTAWDPKFSSGERFGTQRFVGECAEWFTTSFKAK